MPLKFEAPKPGQESVWDYPRPPALRPVTERIRVIVGDVEIANSTKAMQVNETSHPPTVYIPPEDVDTDLLSANPHRSFCEWKGTASYYDVVAPQRTIQQAAWYYPNPHPRFAELEGYISFYPGRMDMCYWGEEQVQAQVSDFYGGWITSRIVGPFKGPAGTRGW